MKLYLLRHGKTEYDREFRRVLSPEGREELRKNYKLLSEELDIDTKIFTSPLKRAVESAEILSEITNMDYEILNLLSGTATRNLMYFLGDENYVLISHQPYISMWINDLTGLRVPASMGSIHLLAGNKNNLEFIK